MSSENGSGPRSESPAAACSSPGRAPLFIDRFIEGARARPTVGTVCDARSSRNDCPRSTDLSMRHPRSGECRLNSRYGHDQPLAVCGRKGMSGQQRHASCSHDQCFKGDRAKHVCRRKRSPCSCRRMTALLGKQVARAKPNGVENVVHGISTEVMYEEHALISLAHGSRHVAVLSGRNTKQPAAWSGLPVVDARQESFRRCHSSPLCHPRFCWRLREGLARFNPTISRSLPVRLRLSVVLGVAFRLGAQRLFFFVMARPLQALRLFATWAVSHASISASIQPTAFAPTEIGLGNVGS
ncbi:MAG: hypothetical protein FAZ92_01541 [Accumulibacter sp.]|nr:MAG: hypothetical protein FAZ92_01541 [Accumulibacter sp.]